MYSTLPQTAPTQIAVVICIIILERVILFEANSDLIITYHFILVASWRSKGRFCHQIEAFDSWGPMYHEM